MALISTTLIKFRVNFTYVIFKDKNIFLTFFYLSEKRSYYIITTVLSCSTTSLASITVPLPLNSDVLLTLLNVFSYYLLNDWLFVFVRQLFHY